jgi:8-oxo-dGTP diphosphatase
METPDARIIDTYGHKIRVRVCGICIENDEILLVKHAFGAEWDFWAPPGGGLELGQTAEEALKREFLEETGLIIEVGQFLFACEVVRTPLHAIELFFEVSRVGGTLTTGDDPELPLIRDARFFNLGRLKDLKAKELHNMLNGVATIQEVRFFKGFYRI